MILDGPIVDKKAPAEAFSNGVVLQAVNSSGSTCYADNEEDLLPYKADGWTIKALTGSDLKTFLEAYSHMVQGAAKYVEDRDGKNRMYMESVGRYHLIELQDDGSNLMNIYADLNEGMTALMRHENREGISYILKDTATGAIFTASGM